MIDITKLLSGYADEKSIRYAKSCKDATVGTKKNSGPVVAWNITNKCNYKCSHCYSNSTDKMYEDELSLSEVKSVVDSLKEINTPVILLSGGEPLFRSDIYEVISYIKEKKINVSLSSNGSLIDKSTAFKLKDLGIGYVGISIDGNRDTNDDFRGVSGAFDNSIRAIENCKRAGVKVGLRFTLHKGNYREVPETLKMMEELDINRICFYHLVPSGRGTNLSDTMLDKSEARKTLDILYDYSKKAVDQGLNKEILTVTNHTDGPYIYLKAKREDSKLASSILEKLKRNGGNRSGSAIANIDSFGNVYPDQFSRFMKVGSVRENSFREIWTKDNESLGKLRERKKLLNSKCRNCKWLDICNGNLRARAFNVNGDIWSEDPGCYLGDEEI